jgi:3-hydroxyisobutyrate dehydrogenase-like beta-hydroxyacid dehydrogenase
VLAVATGKDGVIEGKKVRRFVDLSTTGARMAQRIAEALAAKRIVQIDSPVSGGPGGAEKGTLAVMVSGPPAEVEFLRPALAVFGKVFVIGEKPGMGQTMKLANNMLSATAMAATSEAVVMGVKAGLDPGVMIDVINAGSGHNTASRDKFPRAILPRTFDYGFTNGLMYKDLRLCLEEAQELGVAMQVGAMVRDLFRTATSEQGADADFTTVVKTVERAAGVEVRGRDGA